ncbi:MAG: hypothetical protein O2999_11140 [Nitrospirae bacterium]|nr:hypothetical protein [Nitrospirota bacterium]MDA1304833.1 hypothetical protein [Nitrospirota bacterium]
MKNRLLDLLGRFRDLFKKYWYVSLVWMFAELSKDAVFGSLNNWLGKQSGKFWTNIDPLIEWAGRQDFSGLSGWIFLGFLVILLFLSWKDTRPQKGPIGLNGSLEVKKIPGHGLQEKKKLEEVIQTVGDILLEKQELNDGSLGILLTNKRNEVRGPIEVRLVDLKLWSDQFKFFHVVEGYYGPSSPFPMKLEGPNELFPAQPKRYTFWALNGAKDALVLRDLKKSGNTFYGLKKSGLWKASLKISAGSEEQEEEVCFEWEESKPPKFVDCSKEDQEAVQLNPTDLSSEGEFIPLQKAAGKLYGEARRCGSLWATGAEEMSGSGVTRGSSEDILDHMASIIQDKKPIYGKRDPSSFREQISKDELSQHVIGDGGTMLKHILPNEPVHFSDLAVRSKDLDDLIQEMHFQSGFDE